MVEEDIKGFFDNIRWEWMERILKQRIGDGTILNLVGKWQGRNLRRRWASDTFAERNAAGWDRLTCLHVFENIYLHQALDLWLE